MPELPEVETVKEDLKKRVLGRKIRDVRVLYKGIIDNLEVDEFVMRLRDQTIIDITRRGKFLIYQLDNYYLISHLRMEGKYFIKNPNEEINKHDHVIFMLDDGMELRYNDTRKFGKMYLYGLNEIDKSPLNKLGLEPWDKELTVDYLKEKLNKRIAIKTLLLDQGIIAGIGNIYADEILYLAGINPCNYGCMLEDSDIYNIIKYMREVLKKAISLGGTTIHTYTSLDGVTGRFQQELLVHGKKTCSKCSEDVLKIVVNGRGTYYCPKCQA